MGPYSAQFRKKKRSRMSDNEELSTKVLQLGDVCSTVLGCKLSLFSSGDVVEQFDLVGFEIMEPVRINEGLLEGEEVQNKYGGKYYSFKGIPYAQPPVGNLRFKEPQPVRSWTGVRSAKSFGPKCCQFDALYPDQENLSEDCLYLNVYTPNVKPSHLLPVMIYIHGGGFVTESGNDDYYGPEFLIRQGVVIVTLNYRLGVFGFLCLHTPEIPGNAGMKDQVAGMRWVKSNIHNFGGDPENITIFGESAGGGSVGYHLISPMTRGLFKRAIAQSGAPVCWWTKDFESRDRSILLAKKLGCFSEDDAELEEFFKKQPANALINLQLKLVKAQKPFEIFYAITDEKDFGQERFFYGDETDSLQHSVHEGVDIMTGYTKDEGLAALSFGCPLETMINEARFYNEFLVPQWIRVNCILTEQLKVGRRMRQFYFKERDVTEEGLLRFLNMDFFVYGTITSGNFYCKKNKVYFYKFTCYSDRNIYGPAMGVTKSIKDKKVVCHGDDVGYLFPVKQLSSEVDQESESFKLINMVTKLWTNFAKYGNPTPDNSLGVEWKPYNLQTQEYLDLGNELRMDTVPEKEELEFWNSIFMEYLPKYVAQI